MADVARLVVHFEGDTSDLDRAYAHAQKRVKDFKRWGDRQGEVELKGDASDIQRSVRTAETILARYKTQASKLGKANLDADQRPLQRALTQATASLMRYKTTAQRGATVKLDADTQDFGRSIGQVKAALAALPNQHEINIDVDTGSALGKIASLGTSGAGSLSQLNRAGMGVASVFRLAIPAAIALAIASLAPMVGAITAVGAAGAGLALGFGLIGGPLIAVVQKLTSYHESLDKVSAAQEAARSASTSYSQAQQAASEAARNVGTVQASVASQIESAEDGVDSARASHEQSIDELVAAENELKDVRADEPRRMGELVLAEDEAAFRRQQAANSLRKAVAEYGAGSVQAREASLALRSAEYAEADASDALADARANGTAELQSAKGAVVSAREAEKSSAQGLESAEEQLVQTRVQGAEQIRSAQNAATQAQQQANEAMRAAAAAQAKVAEETVTLTPAMQRLYDKFMQFRGVAGRAFAPAMDAVSRLGVKILDLGMHVMPRLGQASLETTRAVSGAFDQVRKTLSAPIQIQSYDRILDAVPSMTAKFTRAAGNFGGGIANWLAEGIPYAQKMMTWIERISEQFLRWTQSERGRQMINKFLQAAAVILPPLVKLFGRLAWELIRISSNPQVVMVLRGIVWGLEQMVQSVVGLRKLLNFLNRFEKNPWKALRDAWRNLDIRWEGSVAQDGFQSIAAGIRGWGSNVKNFWVKNIWAPMQRSQNDRLRGMSRSLTNWRKGAINWVKSLGPGIVDYWRGSIWGRAAKFLMDRAKGMLRTLSNFRSSAVKWVKSMVPNVVDFWRERVWQPAANFLVDRSKGMLNTLGNWKSGAVNWVKSLPSAIGELWKKFWQGMADFVSEKKDGILNTMKNLVDGVKDFWNGLIGFINTVLDKVGLPKIGEGSSDDSAKGRARGGLDTGKYNDPSRQPLGTQFMARGGLADGRKPRVVYGEAGPEAYVTLGRYTRESAEALTRANEVWGAKGWLDKARRERTQRHTDEGEGLGPTHYNLVPEVKEKANAIAAATGTKWNSYVGHGQLGGSTSDYTADFWGPGGRGDPISKSAGYKTADLALNKYNENPGLLYMIRQGEYWRGGNWSSNTFGDPHYDHTHVSWDSPGGASAGGFMASVWERLGEPFWNKWIQPRVDKFSKSMDQGFILRQAGAKAVTDTIGNIKEWIISKVGASGTGGSVDQWIKEGLEYGNAFAPTSQNVSTLRGRVMQESGGDPNAVNNWDSNAQAGTPSKGLIQIIEPTWESYRKRYGQDTGPFDSNWNDPRMNVATSSRYMKGTYGHIVGAGGGGYRMGGVIPGPGGKPVLAQAHAGERILPREMVQSFDRLAVSINNFAQGGAQGARAPSRGLSVNSRGVFMPGLSVTARGVSVNPAQLHRGAAAQEDTARTMRKVEKRLGDLDKRIGREVREGVNKNIERGLNTNRAMEKSDARRIARQLAGGPRISRAL